MRSSVSLPERGVSIPTLSSSGFSPLRAVSEPELLADRALISAEAAVAERQVFMLLLLPLLALI